MVDKQSRTRTISAAAFYFTCSLSMNFLNKAVVSSYAFNFPFFILACQMAVTIILLDLLRFLRVLQVTFDLAHMISPHPQVPGLSLKESLDFMPCSGCFATHSSLSLIALHGMNIPMYGAIKRCTPLVNLVLSVVILKKARPSALLISSIALITAGAFVASLGDLQFEPYAYTMGTLSVLAQAAYLTLIQRNAEFNHRSTVEMLHITSITTLPIFLTMSLVMGEPDKMRENSSVLEPGFCIIFLLLLVSGRLFKTSRNFSLNSDPQPSQLFH